MEINELVAQFEAHLEKEDDCDPKNPPATNWEARVNEWGTLVGCTGTRLYQSMTSLFKGKKDYGYLGGPEPFVEKQSVAWNLDEIKPDQFPIQAHHLIPKNHLPSHQVCTFLAKKYGKHPRYRLEADSPYDTDHANNGYCMPYATPLAEWKKAQGDDDAKALICYEVMDLTHRQLHQGSHRADSYVPDPSDPDEEAKIHPTGYLNVVDKYLKVVQVAAQKHTDQCAVCKPNKGKKEILPREVVVQHVDQVSGIVKLLIDANRTFISEPAHLWWSEKPKRLKRPKWMRK